MNRRKQQVLPFEPGFHDRRKRWADRRNRSRFWGIILVPYTWLKRTLCALLGLEYERH